MIWFPPNKLYSLVCHTRRSSRCQEKLLLASCAQDTCGGLEIHEGGSPCNICRSDEMSHVTLYPGLRPCQALAHMGEITIMMQ